MTGAMIKMHRRLAWNETDAAGHNHFSAAFRWMEEAEHELLFQLGITESLIDRVPRVHIEIDYTARILFNEAVVVTVAVEKLGSASCTFAFSVEKADGTRAASGKYITVHTSGTTEGSEPWPDDIREKLGAPVVIEVMQRSQM